MSAARPTVFTLSTIAAALISLTLRVAAPAARAPMRT